MFWDWLKEQIYNFNIIGAILIIVFSTSLSKYNMNKEIKAISNELYRDVEELKDTIRDATRMK